MEKWDDIALEWVDGTRDDWWRAHSDRLNRRLLERWLPGRSGRVLKTDLFDEAVGPGLWDLLCDGDRCAVGFDVSRRVAEAARVRYPGMEAVVGDVRCLPFEADSFDAIVSLSTLDHFREERELKQSLAELRRVLKRGGQLVLTMDNRMNPAIALRNALPYELVRAIGLVPYYVGVTGGPRRLIRLVRQAGFDVVEVMPVVHCPRLAAVMAGRVLRRLVPGAWVRYSSALASFERLGSLPTRFQTAHFVALRCLVGASHAPEPAPGRGRDAWLTPAGMAV